MDGTPFGRYRLIELLGRGGMGEVWRAHDTDTDRIVAIKVLPALLSDDVTFQQRFRREAHAAARLDTPHVIPIHHYGEIDGRLYVDMRLIKGRDLQQVLADGPLDPARAVRIIEQVAKALHAAHEVGLVHRDVKPSNILLDKDDFAYLIDFGIARAMDETRLTSTGNAIGTFHYMAPERLGDHPTDDARADIYALACVLYECLTGQPPFAGASMGSLVAAHLNTPPPKPSTTQPNVPPQVDKVIATGMAKDPDNRYATTVELADAAHDAITVPIPRPEPTVPAQPPYRPAPVRTAPAPPGARQRTPPPPQVAPSAARLQRPPHEVPSQRREPSAAVSPPPPQPAPPTKTWVRRFSRRTNIALIAAAVAIVAVIAAGVGIPAIVGHPPHSTQVVLPFTGLSHPDGVAVDSAGNPYVADSGNSRVVKLPAGSASQEVLPFTGLSGSGGTAVDSAGNVYVADSGSNNRVLKLPAGSPTQEVLPFTGLNNPSGVAVDSAGTLYVTDRWNSRVLKLPAGSSTQEVLPFTGLNTPDGVAVDSAGNVYVADSGSNNRVLKLPAGSSTPEVLPFTDLKDPIGVAVDSSGTLYVTDYNSRVLKLPAGSASQAVLPFTGLNYPEGVAVDAAGNLYVTDTYNDRVLKLPAQ